MAVGAGEDGIVDRVKKAGVKGFLKNIGKHVAPVIGAGAVARLLPMLRAVADARAVQRRLRS